MTSRCLDPRRGGLVQFEVPVARVPVSSRGQDTWFSATGPGFESPYRYHPSLACLRERASDGKPSFAHASGEGSDIISELAFTDRRRMSTVDRFRCSRAKVGPHGPYQAKPKIRLRIDLQQPLQHGTSNDVARRTPRRWSSAPWTQVSSLPLPR